MFIVEKANYAGSLSFTVKINFANKGLYQMSNKHAKRKTVTSDFLKALTELCPGGLLCASHSLRTKDQEDYAPIWN